VKFTYKSDELIKSISEIFRGAFFIFLFIIFSLAENSFSQSDISKNYNLRSLEELSGSNYSSGFQLSDTIKKKSDGKAVFRMKKSPWKAVAFSAILPGAGQFYNESYWKIPVIAGLGGYFVYEWIRNNNSYLDYKEQYINSQTPENPAGNPQLQALRESYRDQRDNFIIYSVILYVVNLIDAYVDAQLYDFDVSDNIKLGIMKKNKIMNLSFSF